MLMRPRGRVFFFSQRAMAVHGVMCLLLLFCQVGARNSWAAGVVTVASVGNTAAPPSSPSSSWSGGGGRGRGGEVEEEEEEEEEEEDQIPVGDRSAQIIRQQDAEEGEGWEEKEAEEVETAWSPKSADTIKDNSSLCPKPRPPENGYIKGDDYDDGGVVHIFCEAGYTLQGPHKLTCIPVPYPGAPGIWLPEDEYRCLPAEPRVVELRTLGGNHIEEGPSYAVYNSVIKHWDDTDNKHEKKGTQKKTSFAKHAQCPKPTAPQHGRLEGTDYSLYATVRVTCDEGYSLIGPDHITCLPVPDPFHLAGMWEPQHLPRCQAPPPSTLPLILIQELGKAARVHHPNAVHRRTDTRPDATQVEGLQTLCSLPKVVGPCRARIPRYYFDTTLMECRPFNYGGCQANDNNFQTFSDCQSACR